MSKFYPWIDTANDKVMSATDFENDSQRKSGFQSGQAASSIRVNSALRQANLFVAALANTVLSSNSNLSLTSSLTDVENALKAAHPFNLPIKLSSLGSNNVSMFGTSSFSPAGNNSLSVGQNEAMSSNAYVFGTRNYVEYSNGAFVFGTGLSVESNYAANYPIFVTGAYNYGCEDILRETGAGTSSSKKTVEKLDKNGNLYVKSVVLSDNITNTNDSNDVTITKVQLKNLYALLDSINSSWTQQKLNVAKLPSKGTYHIRVKFVSTSTTFVDFGIVYFDTNNTIQSSTIGSKALSDDYKSSNVLLSFELSTSGQIQLLANNILVLSGLEYTNSIVYWKRVW